MAARRTGVIHAWGDDAPADFVLDSPVPVVVRDPLTREVLGRGSVASGRVRAGDLWADIDWPEDIEALAGSSTPSARCKFDGDGRLVRVVVELDDGPDDDPGEPDRPASGEADERSYSSPGDYGDHATPSTRDVHDVHDDSDVNDFTYQEDRQAETAGDPSSPNRRQAEMAANERSQTTDDNAHAAMAGHDDGHEPTLAELKAERERMARVIAETNRKAKADRLRVEEFEKAQREAEEAKLGEGDRLKRERDTAAQAKVAAENEIRRTREELERFRLDVEIERQALAAGFEFPEQAPALVDRDLIDFDEDTRRPLNLKDVIKRLVEKYPNLVKPTPGRPGTPPRTGPVARNGAAERDRNEPLDMITDLRRKVNYPGR